ncbi:hypothetical protein NHJ13734_004819, partial [Beauveria thailandica]
MATTTTPDTAAPFVALEQPAVEALARILYFSRATMASPPKTEAVCQRWLRRQKRQIANLDETSLRRPRTLSLLGDVLFRGGALARRPQETLEAEGTAALCTSHRRLDPRVLTALMALVAEEVTGWWAESGKGEERWDERKRKRGGGGVKVEEEEAAAAAAVEVWRKRIVKIAVLWMGRRRWEDEMRGRRRRSIGELEVPPCARYPGCCAACKLAVVGGSVQFLMDLRTSLLARRELARRLQEEEDDDDEPPPPPPPPLLRMVEAWIDVCYTRRRRRFMRTESDMMVNLLVRMQMSGGGSGRKVSGRKVSGGEQTRKYRQRAWPMPVEVDELIRSDDDDDDDTEEEEEEDECGRGGPTQWRRRKRMSKEEGYSQYLSASLRAVPEPWTVRGGGTATHNATHDAKRSNAGYRRAAPAPARPEYASPCRRPTPPPPPPPPPRPFPPVEPPWATPDYDPPAAEPWHADYDRSVGRQSTWSRSSSSATLCAIYDAYTAARSTTTTATTAALSLCAPSSPILTQR